MEIGIIGGAGRMGTWLANLLTAHGHQITISDIFDFTNLFNSRIPPPPVT